MNIDQAIEILKDILRCVQPGAPPEEHDAIQLGIEALNLIIKLRTHPYFGLPLELPGETKEVSNKHT